MVHQTYMSHIIVNALVYYTSTSSRKFLFDNISENDFETAPIAAINNPINELTII